MTKETKLSWGRNPKLEFQNAGEYYKALGHLTNSSSIFDIVRI